MKSEEFHASFGHLAKLLHVLKIRVRSEPPLPFTITI